MSTRECLASGMLCARGCDDGPCYWGSPYPAMENATTGRISSPSPALLTDEEGQALRLVAERTWTDLQNNQLGGYSGVNRPFYLVWKFKEVLEKFGYRDVGLRHSKNALDEAYERGKAEALAKPIPMVLHCPACGLQHIDAPEHGDAPPGSAFDGSGIPAWANPPHRSHLCHGCGHTWRPADVPTVGVQAVATRGKNDSRVMASDLERASRFAKRVGYDIT